MEIRTARAADLPYLYEICLKTGLSGGDASQALHDGHLVGHYFAAPYFFYDPSLCFVLADDGQPCGYVLGAADTKDYHRWLNTEWLPDLRKMYSRPPSPVLSGLETFLYQVIHEDASLIEELEGYPAHLHIDLLPPVQRKGWGRKLIEVFLEACQNRGASGIHLGVSETNYDALLFYPKTGFSEFLRKPGVVFMGRSWTLG